MLTLLRHRGVIDHHHSIAAFGGATLRIMCFGNRAVVRLTAGQQNGEEAPLSICKCVYLRVAPSARAANSLLLLPPYGWPAPPAELVGDSETRGSIHGYCGSRH